MPLLVDTGVLYALADSSDRWHGRVREFLTDGDEILLAPVTILAEVTYLLQTRLGPRAERAFVRSLATGELDIEPLRDVDLTRSELILERYPEMGFVDASIVAMAERLKLGRIATTDRRHFSSVRPAHVTAFDLVP
jgi:predicted nucleic acid-binding protein